MKKTFRNLKRLLSTSLAGLTLSFVSNGTSLKAMNYSYSPNFSYPKNDDSILSNDFFVGLGISSLIIMYCAYSLASNGTAQKEETKTSNIKRNYSVNKNYFEYNYTPSYVPASPYLNGGQKFQDNQQYANLNNNTENYYTYPEPELDLPSLEKLEAAKKYVSIGNNNQNTEATVN